MRIAILLPGEPRFTGDFRIFVNNLKGYDQADWFCYLTNNYTPPDPSYKTVKWDPTLHTDEEWEKNSPRFHHGTIPNSWANYGKKWAIDKITEHLPSNNSIKGFEISDVESQTWPDVVSLYEKYGKSDLMKWYTPRRIFSQFYNIFKSNQLRTEYEKLHNFKYDLVIRTRADSALLNEVDLRNFNLGPNTIILPDNDWHGSSTPINDQFAFGNSDNMTIYTDLVNHIKMYNDRGVDLGPETLLGYHLTVNNISYQRGGFRQLCRTVIDDPSWH